MEECRSCTRPTDSAGSLCCHRKHLVRALLHLVYVRTRTALRVVCYVACVHALGFVTYVCCLLAGTILNPIGAGDTVSAVLLAASVRGELPMVQAFATALAAGTASCLRVEGSSFTAEEVHHIAAGVVVRRVYGCASPHPRRPILKASL